MHFHVLSSWLCLFSNFYHVQASPIDTSSIDSDSLSGGITPIGNFTEENGVLVSQNVTGDAVAANSSSVEGPPETDTWKIEGTTLTLQLTLDRAKGIKESDVLSDLSKALSDIQSEPDDEELADEYNYDNRRYNAIFYIEPSVARVLTWKDVKVCISGLRQYYTIVRKFNEVSFGVEEEKEAGDRGRFAQGGLVRRHPTPKPPAS